jgi:spore germination cell wall hydrolase CwlJ-like protein
MSRFALPCSFADLDIMVRTVYGEARGEIPAGQIAVAWCIRNRAELDLHRDGKPDWWGEGIAGVCQKPYQFSCWLPADPMFPKIRNARTAQLAACLQACFSVLGGEAPDPTGGATHYYASSIAAPAWAVGRTPIAVIGAHRFFRLI